MFRRWLVAMAMKASTVTNREMNTLASAQTMGGMPHGLLPVTRRNRSVLR